MWAEICSYIKGSAEAVRSVGGHLDLAAYLALGAKRAPNFSRAVRECGVWPVFLGYEREKARLGKWMGGADWLPGST